MRILIAGVDGYLGWSLAMHLASRGHEVAGADNFFRRRWVEEMGSCSAVPISPMDVRLAGFRDAFGAELRFWEGDLRDHALVERMFREFRPEAVVQLAECPSAPYSMIDRDHAVFVQTNNITTTFNLLFAIKDIRPEVHLLKLGTMGEYGTPNVDIPEGFFEVDYRGRRDTLPFPRQAGSWYHWSKVHGSNNVMFASRMWGLRATDVMQGVVFGTRTDEMGEDVAERVTVRQLAFWETVSLAVVVVAVFPGLVEWMAGLIGVTQRGMFLLTMGVLGAYVLVYYVSVSQRRSDKEIRRLNQELALLRYQVEYGKGAEEDDAGRSDDSRPG